MKIQIMKNQVTFGHILTILAIIIIPLVAWGITIETRFEQVIDNKEDIEVLQKDKKADKELIIENHKEVMEGLHKIELQLKDKKDRE